MTEFIDIRARVLNREITALVEPIYIPRLGGWLNIVEPRGDERNDILQESIDQKTGHVNMKIMYAAALVRTLCYPSPDARPSDDTPHVEEYPMDHPHAGELIFQPTDRAAVSRETPGSILEQVAQVAFPMCSLNPSDLEAQKNA